MMWRVEDGFGNQIRDVVGKGNAGGLSEWVRSQCGFF